MDVLVEIVRNLLLIIIVSSFLELLLPEGALRPFVRFTIGLFVLIAILNPALSFLYDDHNFKIKMWDYREDLKMQEEILDNGNKINEQIADNGREVVKDKVQGQISAVVMLVEGVEGVETQVFMNNLGTLEKMNLLVKVLPEEGVKDIEGIDLLPGLVNQEDNDKEEIMEKKIRAIVKNLYGLKNADIKIEFQGGISDVG